MTTLKITAFFKAYAYLSIFALSSLVALTPPFAKVPFRRFNAYRYDSAVAVSLSKELYSPCSMQLY